MGFMIAVLRLVKDHELETSQGAKVEMGLLTYHQSGFPAFREIAQTARSLRDWEVRSREFMVGIRSHFSCLSGANLFIVSTTGVGEQAAQQPS